MLLMGHCKTERSEQYLFITPDKKQIPTNSFVLFLLFPIFFFFAINTFLVEQWSQPMN